MKHNNKTKKKHIKCENSFKSFEKTFNKKESEKKQQQQDIENNLIKLLKTPFTPSKIKLKNDYYTYINYKWINNTSNLLKNKSKYYVQYDSFRVTQEKVNYELMDIVKEYIKNNNNEKSKAINSVYKSLYNLNNKSAENYVLYITNKIDDIINNGSIYDLFGMQNKNELVSWGLPIVWNVMKDLKNVDKYKSYISAPQLTLYDYDLYIDDNNNNVYL